jgi:hypothetical protein
MVVLIAACARSFQAADLTLPWQENRGKITEVMGWNESAGEVQKSGGHDDPRGLVGYSTQHPRFDFPMSVQ